MGQMYDSLTSTTRKKDSTTSGLDTKLQQTQVAGHVILPVIFPHHFHSFICCGLLCDIVQNSAV